MNQRVRDRLFLISLTAIHAWDNYAVDAVRDHIMVIIVLFTKPSRRRHGNT